VRRRLSDGDHAVAIPPDGLRKTSFTEVRIKIGNTDLAGEFSVDVGKERPLLRAALRSESADLSDGVPF